MRAHKAGWSWRYKRHAKGFACTNFHALRLSLPALPAKAAHGFAPVPPSNSKFQDSGTFNLKKRANRLLFALFLPYKPVVARQFNVVKGEKKGIEQR